MPHDCRESEDDFGDSKSSQSEDTIRDLRREVKQLQDAIRKHRDERGDDRCWLDDRDLYSILPEGFTPPAEDSCVELDRCRAYIASRHDPATSYLSPQRKIEALEAKFEEMRLFYLGREAMFLKHWNGL